MVHSNFESAYVSGKEPEMRLMLKSLVWVVEWQKLPDSWRRFNRLDYNAFAFARGKYFSRTVNVYGVGLQSDVETQNRRSIPG